ncbi:endo-beta-1,3-galactanase [Mycena leptocephala]|nr:endo-beta-1,3-galactanase [Mycena leptocephala]KAJ7910615.1 endo-beta-1,3-galactanase [Mycena leptocephala]
MLFPTHIKAALALAATTILNPVYAATTVIPVTSFSSISTFESFWAYLYPWGSDHNGSARMVGNSTDHSHINVASSTLSLIATPTSNPSPPTSTANPNPAIHYASGAIHAKSQITVTSANSYTISGDFSSPTVRGAWPAFWLTAVSGWPPETDIGEWKGTNDNWFNTFNTSSIVKSTLVAWPADLSFHSLKAVLTAESNNADVRIDFYMDNVLQVTQFGQGFVGKALWLIINLQMEGSSGSPGPTGTTTYKVRNLLVTRSGS